MRLRLRIWLRRFLRPEPQVGRAYRAVLGHGDSSMNEQATPPPLSGEQEEAKWLAEDWVRDQDAVALSLDDLRFAGSQYLALLAAYEDRSKENKELREKIEKLGYDFAAEVTEIKKRAAADCVRLEGALRDFESKGVRADLTPTMNLRTVPELYADFARYLDRLDEGVRERARQALQPRHRDRAWMDDSRFIAWMFSAGALFGFLVGFVVRAWVW